jgi:GNAT superfamily N-acetyltransferase
MEIIQDSSSISTEEIVDLLKTSLGESTTKKSVEFWNWKHIDNPFGKSTIVLAKDENRIVAVRAFMKWQFDNNTQSIICGRAVDTAVHPDYQGKGIFTKLTLQAIDKAEQENVDLIFNSPNKISKVGYLKMGWLENGRMPIKIAPTFCIPNKFEDENCNDIFNEYSFPTNLILESILINSKKNNFETPINTTIINWRYKHCPVNKYGCIYNEGEYLIVFRLKKVNKYIELRLCDVVFKNDEPSINKAIIALHRLCKKVKPLFISCANSISIPKSFYSKLLFSPLIKFGPDITLRTVSKHSHIEYFKEFKYWQPSLGCMELF